MSCNDSHYYRQVWYWGGEADLRVNGKKMELAVSALLNGMPINNREALANPEALQQFESLK